MSGPGYVTFQQEHAEPPVLNIGVGANPAQWSGEDYVHVDIDRWNYPNMVQGDAHQLPFRSDSFTTAVLGDVLEHVPEPIVVLREAARIAPKVVMTTFQEWRLGRTGRNIEVGVRLFAPTADDRKPYLDSGRCLAFMPESTLTHTAHIWQWSRPLLDSIIRMSGLRVEIEGSDSPGVHDGHELYNYLFVLRRIK